MDGPHSSPGGDGVRADSSNPALRKFGVRGAKILSSLLGGGVVAAPPLAAQSSTPSQPEAQKEREVKKAEPIRVMEAVYGPPPSLRRAVDTPDPVRIIEPRTPAPVYGPPPTPEIVQTSIMDVIELPAADARAADDFIYRLAAPPQWVGENQLALTIATTIDERTAKDPKRYVFKGPPVQVTVANVLTFQARKGNDGPLRPMTRITLVVTGGKPASVALSGMIDALNNAPFHVPFTAIAPPAPK